MANRAPKQWCLTKVETVNSYENWRQNLLYTLSLDPNFLPYLEEGATWGKKTRANPHRNFVDDGDDVPEANRKTRAQKPSERPEDLFQRLMAFTEDNLLKTELAITHNGQEIQEDEELTPTMENFIVLTWLTLIHPDLPRLVKQRYGTELRSRTLATLKPEISQALDSLLEELRTTEDARAMRTQFSSEKKSSSPQAHKSCPLCKATGRPSNHYLSKCLYLPQSDKRYLAKARQIIGTDDNHCSDEEEGISFSKDVSIGRVQIRQSPYIDAFLAHHSVRIIIDSGATGNMIRSDIANNLRASVTPSSQYAHQADGLSPLHVSGETRLTFNHDGQELTFEGLVVDNLDTPILAGIPFMEANDITVRPARQEIRIGDKCAFRYGSKAQEGHHSIRLTQVLRAPVSNTTTLWPGEYIEVKLPDDMTSPDEYNTYSLEPTSYQSPTTNWPPPSFVDSVAGKIRIANLSNEPRTIKRNQHLCLVRPTFSPDALPNEITTPVPKLNLKYSKHTTSHSAAVNLDPDNTLSPEMKAQFMKTLDTYSEVFNPTFKGYNGASGPLKAVVNMGQVKPPQRKGRLPQYNKQLLSTLQDKFDELEACGVFAKPEIAKVNVEYVNPSFLVKKPSGGFRLVTAFADVGRYSKPQPSLMPDVDSTLRQIAQWKYIAITDLTQAFYQIPLAKESMKYCGVVTPFRGVRVYARSAMGMPGSETILEELTCRVLGDLVQEGVVAKLADDLYCGGSTPEDLLNNFTRTLHALQRNGLNLSASKTVIAPRETTILGWIWREGTLRASPHRIAALATCQPPSTVTGLRSFIGAFKVLGRVLKGCSQIISPLDTATAGKDSKDKIQWTDDLHSHFEKAQKSLSSSQTITLPQATDQLWIVTDGALRSGGLGATLYVNRNNKLYLSGFFSAKLRGNQHTWLPCEVEALSISAAVKHFSPYIVQSSLNACVLTDSKPCVQAFEKMCRGEFSASPRVSTFLSTVSRFQVSLRHVSGAAILPTDFSSRNVPTCDNPSCQICTFVNATAQSVVQRVTTEDIEEGRAKMPFTTRTSWLTIQQDCPDLRRTHAHLLQGTRPSKKLTNVRDVKRYLQHAVIAKDGLLVVTRNVPFHPTQECIIVPRSVLEGLLTSIHISLDHPTASQLKKVVNRFFFALDMDKAINNTTEKCHQCTALKSSPKFQPEHSSSQPPERVGYLFAVDVLKRERQLILVLREYVTSYTRTLLIENERHETLREGLLILCSELLPLDGPFAVIRTDPAPGFAALIKDKLLAKHRISIEVGHVKNINKNPVAERAIQELEAEILRHDPMCRTVTPLSLCLITSRLNTRIRSRGVSAKEMWTHRDQFSHEQIPVDDYELISKQHDMKLDNHPHSQASKQPGKSFAPECHSRVGDLVYLYCDRNKSKTRDRYIVVSCDGEWRHISKFSGSQLRRTAYRVKDSDCYLVPSEEVSQDHFPKDLPDDACDEVPYEMLDSENNLTTPSYPSPPPIPAILSDPPTPLQPPVPSDEPTELLISETIQPDSHSALPPIHSDDASQPRPTRVRHPPKWLSDYMCD
uniref:Uncharacterized protein LOC111115730 isoform X2 n=1 Tax=Crassostrea virginica TaxID=6565 RepID=A0A8B8C592_CRAVI|nr:uncharacterized protein LOC111115730 isoform X2 [Crassostrea virginica]